MMVRQLFILILILSSCSDIEINNTLTKLANKDNKASSIKVATDTLLKDVKQDDTIFIKRRITKDFYHAIYIDTTRDSKYYDRLTNFDFGEYDLRSYNGNYKFLKEKNPKIFKKVNSTEIPENWLPVYLYNDHYYLYAPSDWGSAGRRIINDSAFVYWYMDGPLPVPLTNVIKMEDGKTILEMMEPFSEKSSNDKLTIHQIDPKTNLSVFEFTNEPEIHKYKLYIPVESANRFNMIVNYCDNQKQMEFDFNQIDFEKLIKKSN